MSLADFEERYHVRTLTIEMDWHNYARQRSYCCLYSRCIYVVCAPINIDENRPRSEADNCCGSGKECERGGDYFVAGFDRPRRRRLRVFNRSRNLRNSLSSNLCNSSPVLPASHC